MKKLHLPHLYAWSHFDEERNIDFHSVLWQRNEGNILIDPLPLSEHDRKHLDDLGGAAMIIVTNSDHSRATAAIARMTGADVFGPDGEQQLFPLDCRGWLTTGDELVSGLDVIALDGSKTPGELALIIEQQTLVTGDLVRCHVGGQLCLLPDAKLSDKALAIESVIQLAGYADIQTVLPGDGWPLFNNGGVALRQLAESF